jgi:integrase
MTASHSTPSTPAAKPTKPAKPYPEFPLFPHPMGYWAKKIRGKMHYFGPWADPDAALAKYLEQKEALHAGKKPRPDLDTLTLKQLANHFLNHKKNQVEAGELSTRMWADYRLCADVLVDRFGKQRIVADIDTDDFAELRVALAKRWGPVTLGNFIQRVRSVFKYAYESGLLDGPMRFGPGFARPSKKTLRLDRAKKGNRMLEADEIRRALDAAGSPLKAMILLGINCGFGNADCGTLPLTALDVTGRWVNFPRPKTGIPRRCPLWPETVEAIREALSKRPEPKDQAHVGLVFVTKYGGTWVKATGAPRADDTPTAADNPISKEMRKLLDGLGINGSRNFYALRHAFETIGGEVKDQIAVDHIMGHARDDMASVYRERIGDERLKAVTDHVGAWLFAPPKKIAESAAKPQERTDED